MEERNFKIVKKFKYRNRLIVIVQCKWEAKVKKIAHSMHDYCNGYVSVVKSKQKLGLNYNEVPIQSTELTFSGNLNLLEDNEIKDIEFLGFDLTHSWNYAENSSPECAEKIAKELADEMIRKGF